MLSLIIFIFGLMIGSFLNVCIYRIPKGESIAYPPSHCYSCGRQLKAFELIPALSYVSLRGKCRGCGSKISIRYPIIEILTGLIFMLLHRRLGFNLDFYLYGVLACILIVVALIDIDHLIIPDGLVLAGLAVGVLYRLLGFAEASGAKGMVDGIIGLLVGGGIFLLLALISNGGMGGGDIKLMAMLGLWFGWRNILFISLIAFIIGSIISIVLLIFKLKSRKDFIPFGPFIVLAVFICLLLQQEIIGWYLQLVLSSI